METNAGQPSPVGLVWGDQEIGREILVVAFSSLAGWPIARLLCMLF